MFFFLRALIISSFIFLYSQTNSAFIILCSQNDVALQAAVLEARTAHISRHARTSGRGEKKVPLGSFRDRTTFAPQG